MIQKSNKREKERKILSARILLKHFKRIVKDEYMLVLFESEEGNLNNLKKANELFDHVYMGLQMHIIIWIVSITIGLIMYFYLRDISLPFWFSLIFTFLMTYLIRKVMQMIALGLIYKANIKEANK